MARPYRSREAEGWSWSCPPMDGRKGVAASTRGPPRAHTALWLQVRIRDEQSSPAPGDGLIPGLKAAASLPGHEKQARTSMALTLRCVGKQT